MPFQSRAFSINTRFISQAITHNDPSGRVKKIKARKDKKNWRVESHYTTINFAQPTKRFELLTPGLRDQCSNHWATEASLTDLPNITFNLISPIVYNKRHLIFYLILSTIKRPKTLMKKHAFGICVRGGAFFKKHRFENARFLMRKHIKKYAFVEWKRISADRWKQNENATVIENILLRFRWNVCWIFCIRFNWYWTM